MTTDEILISATGDIYRTAAAALAAKELLPARMAAPGITAAAIEYYRHTGQVAALVMAVYFITWLHCLTDREFTTRYYTHYRKLYITTGAANIENNAIFSATGDL